MLLLAGVCWLGWQWLRVPDKAGRAFSRKPAIVKAPAPAPKQIPPGPTPAPGTNAAATAAIPSSNHIAKPVGGPYVPITPLPEVPPQISISDLHAYPRPPRDTFETQVALARRGFSPGAIDGAMGSRTRAALRAFQQSADLHETGELDAVTRSALGLNSPPVRGRTLRPEDFARLLPLSAGWLGKSRQSRLDYESIGELLAEEGQCTVGMLRQLNPAASWGQLRTGSTLWLPAIDPPQFPSKASSIVIRLSDRALSLLDSQDKVMAHFPCSIARRVEKRPTGRLSVEVIIPDPDYTFDPRRFPESAEARSLDRKLVLPPGPNNPVGIVWVGLNRSGYGIHGTPSPERVGSAESHGCFRLANWNAALLMRLAWVGMPVMIE